MPVANARTPRIRPDQTYHGGQSGLQSGELPRTYLPTPLHSLDQRARWAWGVVGHFFYVIVEDIHQETLSGLGDALEGDVFGEGDADEVVGVRFAHGGV